MTEKTPVKLTTRANRGYPKAWYKDTSWVVNKLKEERPDEEVYGLVLPEDWEQYLKKLVDNGELCKVLGIEAVAFSGRDITRLERPDA